MLLFARMNDYWNSILCLCKRWFLDIFRGQLSLPLTFTLIFTHPHSSFSLFFSASINAVPRVFLASNFLRKHGLRIIIVLQTKEDGIRFNYRYKTCAKNKTLGTDWTTNIMTVKCVKSMNNNTSSYFLDLMFMFLFMAKLRNWIFHSIIPIL